MPDIIYILTNEAMQGYVKIGKTKKSLSQRLKQLDVTSLPLPFECFFAAEVENCDVVERLLHDAFADRRTRKSREFFEIAPERVASALKLAALREITVEDVLDDEARVAIKETIERRAPFNFAIVNVPIGATLVHTGDEATTCQVANSKQVEFEGELVSLSDAALRVYHRLGKNWKTVSGPTSWLYENETLDARRRRIENA